MQIHAMLNSCACVSSDDNVQILITANVEPNMVQIQLDVLILSHTRIL